MDMSPAWAILRDARRRAGLSQRQLAERAGTSQSVVARIEKSRVEPSLDLLLRLVKTCGLDLRMHLEPHDFHDEGLISQALAQTPEERLQAVANLSAFAAAARRVG
jgi:transcriptional regulator with XRE-family HTH domain